MISFIARDTLVSGILAQNQLSSTPGMSARITGSRRGRQSSACPVLRKQRGLISLTRALAVEWAEYGIRVNAISPTFVDNGMNGHVMTTDEIQQHVKRNILLGRAATAQEVAWGMYYWASPMSAMITGHNLLLDGGWTAH
jgi:hypothetical protein